MQLSLGVFFQANGVATEVLTAMNHLKISLSIASINQWLDEQAKDIKESSQAKLANGSYFFAADNVNKYQSPRHFGIGSSGQMFNGTMRFAFNPRQPQFTLAPFGGDILPDDSCVQRVKEMMTKKVDEILKLDAGKAAESRPSNDFSSAEVQ